MWYEFDEIEYWITLYYQANIHFTNISFEQFLCCPAYYLS